MKYLMLKRNKWAFMPWLALSLCLFFPFTAMSTQTELEDCKVPPLLTFSSLKHPKVQQDIQPFLVRVYQRIGVDIEFTVTSSYRDLMLVSKNALMGSAIFAEDIVDTMPEVIAVHPPIMQMSYVLLCKKGHACDESVLTDAERSDGIAASTAMSKTTLLRYPELSSQRMMVTNQVKNVLELLDETRVNYGIYPISDRHHGGLKEIPTRFDHAILYDLQSFHVISEKLSCLLPKIEDAMRAELTLLK